MDCILLHYLRKSMFERRENCPVCKNTKKTILFEKEFGLEPLASFLQKYYEGRVAQHVLEGAPFVIAECMNCQFIWQLYAPSGETADALYSTWINPITSLKKKQQGSFGLYKKYRIEVEKIALLIPKEPYKVTVLDFGMGWGYWCLMAKAHGYKVWGFEIASDRITHAKEQGINVFEREEELMDRKFDFINLEQVLEHVPDPLPLLLRLKDMLAPNGILHVAVPDGSAIKRDLEKPNWAPKHDAIHPLEHINCFTKKTLRDIASRSGFDIVEIKEPNSIQSMCLRLLRRKKEAPANIYLRATNQL